MMKSLSKIAFCFLAFIMPTFCFAGSNSYTTETIPLFADENLTQKIGQLEAGAEIKLVQTTAKAAEIELNLWRAKVSGGFGIILSVKILPMRYLRNLLSATTHC